tara:strand:+ start:549 stop:920 length:372 start_codon:yes stop_codon:yes gene_type:complete
MNLLRQVTFDRANRKKDKSVSMTFITQLEQTTDDFMQIDQILNDSGVLYFKSNGNLSKEEIKSLDSSEIEVEGKTKSQRLRNVLYVYWTQNKEGMDEIYFKSFNDFYSTEVEKIIEHYKNKLI